MDIFKMIRRAEWSCRKHFTREGTPFACAFLAAVTILTAGAANVGHFTVIADGEEKQVVTTTVRPERVISEAGVTMGEYDEYIIETDAGGGTSIRVIRAVPVSVELGGASRTFMTGKLTVGSLLDGLGLAREKYVVSHDDDTPITGGLVIKLRTHEEIAAEEAAVEEAERRRILMAEGPVVETSRGAMRYTKKYVMEATAYIPTDGSPEGLTAMGIPARRGIVAVDPRVIPLGTRVFVPGYGLALAADTGGAIKGYKIDLCMESYDEAMDFGRRDIEVYVLAQ